MQRRHVRSLVVHATKQVLMLTIWRLQSPSSFLLRPRPGSRHRPRDPCVSPRAGSATRAGTLPDRRCGGFWGMRSAPLTPRVHPLRAWTRFLSRPRSRPPLSLLGRYRVLISSMAALESCGGDLRPPPPTVLPTSPSTSWGLNPAEPIFSHSRAPLPALQPDDSLRSGFSHGPLVQIHDRFHQAPTIDPTTGSMDCENCALLAQRSQPEIRQARQGPSPRLARSD